MRRTKLLISVRSAEEARIALHAGADIIDVKEPTRGSLGRSSLETIHEIAEIIANQAPLSVALGEWYQSRSLKVPQNIAWAKVGFSHCSTALERHRGWLIWLKTQQKLQSTRLIGVIYADRIRVNGPCFEQVRNFGLNLLTTWSRPILPAFLLIPPSRMDEVY